MKACPAIHTRVMLLLACPLIIALPASAAPVTLKLTDGSAVKGEVVSRKDGELTAPTEFGVIRLPEAKLTGETRPALAPASPRPWRSGWPSRRRSWRSPRPRTPT
jgi:hypothetical protein